MTLLKIGVEILEISMLSDLFNLRLLFQQVVHADNE